jgi:hypothetical protein
LGPLAYVITHQQPEDTRTRNQPPVATCNFKEVRFLISGFSKIGTLLETYVCPPQGCGNGPSPLLLAYSSAAHSVQNKLIYLACWTADFQKSHCSFITKNRMVLFGLSLHIECEEGESLYKSQGGLIQLPMDSSTLFSELKPHPSTSHFTDLQNTSSRPVFHESSPVNEPWQL